MVHKIKVFKILVFVIFALAVGIFAFLSKFTIETNLLKALLSDNVENSQDIIKIANIASSNIKVVFESNSEKNLENLEQSFIKNIDKNYFELKSNDNIKLLKTYLLAPSNFLSDETRNLIFEEKYDEIYEKSLEKLYYPAEINLSDFDKDPFILFDNFLNSLGDFSPKFIFDNGKYYSFLTLKINSIDSLSPDLSNKKIVKIINLQHKLSNNNSKIYLAGSPVHSYYTSKNAVKNINIICLLSIFLIIFLNYFYFKNFKLLIPIFSAIFYGMYIGCCATILWFDNLQIITMVFSTMLIGIGIDYSYHYFFTKNHDKIFTKNLTLSLLTTIIPFILLYLTRIELLCQIAVFSIFGLISIYLFVLYIYPCFEFKSVQRTLKINFKYAKFFVLIILIFSLAGFSRFNFDDNLNALYSPSKKLIKAEKLYNKISGNNFNTQFIIVQGNNLNDILEKEEIITSKLSKKNIDYISFSKFIPSEKKQKENFELVKKLYDKKLDNYSKILSSDQILKLKSQAFKPIFFDRNIPELLSKFFIDKNTSLIIILTDKNIKIDENIINIRKDISKYLKSYRLVLIKILPIVLGIIFVFLSFFFGIKKGLKQIFPSLFGMVSSAGFSLLFLGQLNLFSIIALFMVLGFTIDYSIFRTNSHKQTEDAVFVSCITTAFSFLLLSLTGFKLISSITFMLFMGIISSYITGYLIFNKDKN